MVHITDFIKEKVNSGWKNWSGGSFWRTEFSSEGIWDEFARFHVNWPCPIASLQIVSFLFSVARLAFFFLSFFFLVTNGKRQRAFILLVHSPNACNSWVWVDPGHLCR